jgi:hypothetical protein
VVTLYAFTAQAAAGPDVGFPPGERHAMLIFAVAETREVAEAEAKARVEAEGWIGVDLLRGKVVELDPASIAEDTVRGAAQSAYADGCAFVVYRDPILHDG